MTEACDGFEPAYATARRPPVPAKLTDVVRVAPAPGKTIVARIAEDVFLRLGWSDDGMVSIMKGSGALKGKVRFVPSRDDREPQVRVMCLPKSTARTVKFTAAQIDAELEFEIFSAPFDVDGDALTLDLSSIIGVHHAD